MRRKISDPAIAGVEFVCSSSAFFARTTSFCGFGSNTTVVPRWFISQSLPSAWRIEPQTRPFTARLLHKRLPVSGSTQAMLPPASGV